MNKEKFNLAITELRRLERSLLIFASESCESAQDSEDIHFAYHRYLYLRVRDSWQDIISLQRSVKEDYEEGAFSKKSRELIHQYMMTTEINLLVLIHDTKILGKDTEFLKKQVDQTRIAVCDFLDMHEYDITFYKKIYS